jgi:hypothetical protein
VDPHDRILLDRLGRLLHVFDDEVLSAAVRQAGFVVGSARMCSRNGLPAFWRFDDRENLGLIATTPPTVPHHGF